ncbi:hypothetical protein Ppa06_52990 [Planomonospora parontospora subsp. parontospora]|uniref:Lipoprotein n=2 Tax=Planomonospora parontospora TaxID=58119 RepID=A0AA37BLA7_9ACTN|nr:hypothetical protein [Planomonospora parontospora]GGK87945.1 hypothetical protein GCM10010126_54240 [Planomonospora parontospora]GII11501.1 hypothetical protein Ppa06_52990 [Planomonospora parontospora subsp. parontospora]
MSPLAAPRTRSRAALAAAATAVTALALAACTSTTGVRPVAGQATASGVVGSPGAPGGTSPGGPVASATPSPSALTAEAYRAELQQARGPVRDALRKVADTGGLKNLDKRIGQAATAVSEAASRLETLAAPPELAVQHATYLDALRTFGAALDGARPDVLAQETCTGPAVLTKLDRAGDLADMKEAAAALTGYPADVVSVKAAKQKTRRLSNGKIIQSESRTGRGSMKVHNGGSRDAVVVVMRGKKKAFSLYVRKKAKATVPGVRDGSYRVFYTTGTDWDSGAKAFTRSCVFTEFGKSVKFRTTRSGGYIRWNNWTLTLHAVKGGTVRSKPVDPDKFPN